MGRFDIKRVRHCILIFVLAMVGVSLFALHSYAAEAIPENQAADTVATVAESDGEPDQQLNIQVVDGQEETLSPSAEEQTGEVPSNEEPDPSGEPDPGTTDEEDPPADEPADGWFEDETGRYYIENGEYIRSQYKKIEGSWYWFDADGKASKEEIHEAGESPLEEGNRIWFYNVSGSTNSDMILVESNGRYGLIDAGHRYENTITDEDGTVYAALSSAGLSSQISGKNGKDGAIYMIETLGVEHLDFIIGTHAHSDHIGGIPEIAGILVMGRDGVVRSLIDEQTVFIYKLYEHVSSREDDLETSSADSWHNQAFLYQAVRAVNDNGGIVIDTSNPGAAKQKMEQTGLFGSVTYETRSASDQFDDRLAFTFGDFSVSLYNLFPVKDANNENVNSIVTVLSLGSLKAYLAGDLNVESQIEQKLARVVSADHGTMTVMKASHHGLDNSNSKVLIDLLRPSVVICPGRRTSASGAPSSSYRSLKYYAGNNYGTVFYEVGASGKMLVVDLTDGTAQLKRVSCHGAAAVFSSAESCRESIVPEDGWSRWGVEAYSGYIADWYYFSNGSPVTGWRYIDNAWYYFKPDGFMQKDWMDLDGKTYYFAKDGMMRTGWRSIDGDWYYFNTNGSLRTSAWAKDSKGWCWMLTNGKIAKAKWIKDKGEWYYLKANGYMASEEWAKDSKGWCWMLISGKIAKSKWIKDKGEWYYLKANGYMTANGWAKDSKGWCWMLASGKIAKSKWVKSRGLWYYLKANGYMATGRQTIGGKTYRFASDGHWIK